MKGGHTFSPPSFCSIGIQATQALPTKCRPSDPSVGLCHGGSDPQGWRQGCLYGEIPRLGLDQLRGGAAGCGDALLLQGKEAVEYLASLAEVGMARGQRLDWVARFRESSEILGEVIKETCLARDAHWVPHAVPGVAGTRQVSHPSRRPQPPKRHPSLPWGSQ